MLDPPDPGYPMLVSPYMYEGNLRQFLERKTKETQQSDVDYPRIVCHFSF